MRFYAGTARPALLSLWTMFAFSPLVLQEFVTGGDYLANSLYVLFFSAWTVSAVSEQNVGLFWKLLPAVLLGIGLSSRANFVLILPLVFSAMALNAGLGSAIKYTAFSGAAAFAVTAPFYLYDPAGFSPLHASGMLGQFGSMVPAAGILIPMMTGALSALLALRRTNRSLPILLRNCAVVLAFPVLCAMLLSSIQTGGLNFEFAYYGLPVVVFGTVAFWISAQKPRNVHTAGVR